MNWKRFLLATAVSSVWLIIFLILRNVFLEEMTGIQSGITKLSTLAVGLAVTALIFYKLTRLNYFTARRRLPKIKDNF